MGGLKKYIYILVAQYCIVFLTGKSQVSGRLLCGFVHCGVRWWCCWWHRVWRSTGKHGGIKCVHSVAPVAYETINIECNLIYFASL